ncbi:MAG: hypothetical protein J6I76_21660 [Oribacterium sp.]|nr:hypothetical protein [Butyrivibrio sp.]MBP3806463.1 hypothetical protein [Oribacterium sp.]
MINGESSEYNITEGAVIEQAINLENTGEVSVRYKVNNCQDENTELIFSVLQGEKEISKTVYPCEVTNREESWVHLGIGSLENGQATVTVRGNNISEETSVVVYIASNLSGLKPYVPNILINGQEMEKTHLYLIYDHSSFADLLKLVTAIFVIVLILYGIVIWLFRNFLKNPAFSLGIILLLVSILRNSTLTTRISAWAGVLWFLSYKYGFIGKALSGTVIGVICEVIKGNFFLSTEELRCVLLWILGILIFAEMLWIQRTQEEFDNEADKKYKKAVQALLLLFVGSPIFCTYYTQFASFGRADAVITILFISGCFCIIHEKLLWAVPVLSSLAVLCHPLFVFTELPVLIMLLAYEWICEGKDNFRLPLLVTLLSNGFFAVYTQYFSHMKYDFDYVWDDIRTKTDTELSSLLVYGENYITQGEFSDIYHANFVELKIIFTWGTTILTYLPVILVLYLIWKDTFRLMTGNIQRIIVILLALCPLAEVYSFSANVLDQGRYIVLSMTAAFFSLFVLLRKKDKNVLLAVSNTYGKAVEKFGSSWPVYICLYLAYVGFMSEMGVTDITNGLIWVANLIKGTS